MALLPRYWLSMNKRKTKTIKELWVFEYFQVCIYAGIFVLFYRALYLLGPELGWPSIETCLNCAHNIIDCRIKRWNCLYISGYVGQTICARLVSSASRSSILHSGSFNRRYYCFVRLWLLQSLSSVAWLWIRMLVPFKGLYKYCRCMEPYNCKAMFWGVCSTARILCSCFKKYIHVFRKKIIIVAFELNVTKAESLKSTLYLTILKSMTVSDWALHVNGKTKIYWNNIFYIS